MKLKERLSDYTEQEFIELIHEIDRANDDEPDWVLTPLLIHFRKITGHPSGIDLLYRPASEEDGQPEQIVKRIKAWRIANGKDLFKP